MTKDEAPTPSAPKKNVQRLSESKKNIVKPKPAEKPDIASLGIELGTDTNLPFSTPYRPLENGTKKNSTEELLEVGHEWGDIAGPTIRQLITMRRMDGQARALYRLLTLPIRSALSTASFIPAEDGTEEADFIDAVFNTPPEAGGMTVTFHRFMAQMLSGLFDGFAAFEKVYWMPETGPLQGKYTLKKLAHRPPETVTFITDKSGGFAGLRQRATLNGKALDVYIPKEYSFYYAAQEEERKFYGISYFQSAFYHYDKKAKMYFIAHLAAQRAAVGTRAGTVPANATSAAKLEFAQSLNNLAVAQWMMMPDGFKVEVLKETGTFEFLNWVNHHNSQMSKSILAAFFDKEQGAGVGEGSLVSFAGPGDDMFVLMLRAIMDDIANQINHYIIPALVDFNFTGGKYPKFTWGKLTEEQKSAIAITFDKLSTAGQSSTVTPEFMRALEEHQAEEFGLEIDYDEVDAREQQDAEAVNAQQGFDESGMPLPLDPVTGLAIQKGQEPSQAPIDPAAPLDTAAPTEEMASTASVEDPAASATSTDPATAASPAEAVTDPTAPEAPVMASWLDGFEDAVEASSGGSTSTATTTEDPALELKNSLKLSNSDHGLIELAQNLLDQARSELR